MSNKVFVGNLSYKTTDEQLNELFEPFGKIVKASIIKDRETDRSRGFGFVEFDSADDVAAAIEEMNGKEIDGRSLNVNEAHQEKSKPFKRSGGPRKSYDSNNSRFGN